jgi:hypothetical protein
MSNVTFAIEDRSATQGQNGGGADGHLSQFDY